MTCAEEFCRQATDLIADYLSGDLDERTREAFEAHLAACPDCVSFLSTYEETLRAGRALKCEDIPEAMQTRLREFFRARLAILPSDKS